ncbi:extracellular solute-binding protein [Paenibacillus caseinilyticus]|uniref:ABC transporter substrate-binding protein n=1 Tax=Paenibacillus mucilaginosus K02 TaxID=997761 RepID=I0BFR3_9BACL|nr:extracellular solute-binding protein [Paenibacillus mucilaginosus]AFH61210.1 ABC transporter substrate-binding protein [Paenibacillus mucilaginosus K02]
MKKKLVTVISASLLLSSTLAACGEKEEASSASPDGSKSSAPAEFNITTINYSPEAAANDNPIELEMEKRTNTKVNITYLPSNNYMDKFKVMLASGEIPDVLLTTSIYDPSVLNAIQDGVFWDLTPYLKDYPNLQNNYPKESYENTKIDGKIYGLPRPRPLVGGAAFPALRQDWLDKLGLKVPETMDELYTVLKAFAEQDPDGNGKKDTYGFTGSVAEGWMDQLSFVEDTFNGFNNMILSMEGKPTEYRDFSPATREALLWIHRAYKEGVLAPDFAIIKQSQVLDMMKQGKVGMIPTAMDASKIGDMVGTLRKTVPAAGLVHVPYLITPSSGKKYATKEGGFFGNYLISKKVPEEKLKQILAFFDYGATPEGMELANFGLKDVHFTVQDGKKVTTEEYKKIAAASIVNVWTLVDPYSRVQQASTDYPKEYLERDKKVVDERLKHGVFINNNGVMSETEIKFGSEIAKKLQDKKIKVIMGKEPIEAWDKLIEQMKNDANVKKILAEREASYKAIFDGK